MGLLERSWVRRGLCDLQHCKHVGCLYIARISLVSLTLACLVSWISFWCPAWVHVGTGSQHGLWLTCYDVSGLGTKCRHEYGGQYLDRWAVVQASETLAFAGTNAALALFAVYTWSRKLRNNTDVAAITVALCIASGFLKFCSLLVVMTAFTSDYVRDLNPHPVWVRPRPGYCFYLSWAALIFELLAGWLVARDAMARRKRELGMRKTPHWSELFLP